MAFDGVTVCAAASELRHFLTDGYISKISEPENGELLITVKTRDHGVKRLLISTNASAPFICLTDRNYTAPLQAPAFTMLLRKHLQGGRIISISQPSLERVIIFEAEHRDELGDMVRKKLIIELMGKYSNIIFIKAGDDTAAGAGEGANAGAGDGANAGAGEGEASGDIIIDAIRRVPPSMSSVRTVLPGERYFIPKTQDKADPFAEQDYVFFRNHILGRPMNVIKAIYGTYTGFSPVLASELCHRAGMDGNDSASSITEEDLKALYDCFIKLMSDLRAERFAPEIVYENSKPRDFAPVPLTVYEDLERKSFDSISGVIERFYFERNAYDHMRQKSADLRKIVTNAIERTSKKYDIQLNQVKDTDKMDKYRVYAELINTYGYDVPDGSDHFEAVNFYDGKNIRIPLDPLISVHENANRYFSRYEKLKRTKAAAVVQAEESRVQLMHLKSIEASFDTAETEEDLKLIAEELKKTGYIRKKADGSGKRRASDKSRPLHFVSSDGFDIYVGKNNIQNDELTFKTGNGNDWWFHSKTYPGSHVLLVVGKQDPMSVPDGSFNEAGRLAAHYCSGREQGKVDIDYTLVKNVKKPAGAVPGYVIYHTNYSMTAHADISGIKKVDET
ncbi:MAG: NFACT family protein [Lachnospiraceae bacterium]|nr:NFACT family protein [Lachnospiraceae bacterium]